MTLSGFKSSYSSKLAEQNLLSTKYDSLGQVWRTPFLLMHRINDLSMTVKI